MRTRIIGNIALACSPTLVFGSWFPISMLMMTLGGRQPIVFYSMEIFNMIGFALMALLVRSIPDSLLMSRTVFVRSNN